MFTGLSKFSFTLRERGLWPLTGQVCWTRGRCTSALADGGAGWWPPPKECMGGLASCFPAASQAGFGETSTPSSD
jgi:hypothetical protein